MEHWTDLLTIGRSGSACRSCPLETFDRHSRRVILRVGAVLSLTAIVYWMDDEHDKVASAQTSPTYTVGPNLSPQAALDSAARTGGTVTFPAGTYSVGQLVVRNPLKPITISGAGATLSGTDPTRAVLLLESANGVSVRGLTINHASATSRIPNADGIRILGGTGFTVDGVTVENVAAAGILVWRASKGAITNCAVRRSQADGIHVCSASSAITISGNRIEESGDDSIAVVGYGNYPSPCQSITIMNNTVLRSRSRGVTVLGGKQVTVSGNTITTTKNAGIFAGRDGTYGTYGVDDVSITNNTIAAANTYDTPTVNQAAIDIRSSDAAYPAQNIRITGNVINGGGWRMINLGAAGGSVATKNITVDSNQLNGPNADGPGIHALLASSFEITRNYIYRAEENGIYVAGNCTGRIKITNNTIKQCGLSSSPSMEPLVVLVSSAQVSNNSVL